MRSRLLIIALPLSILFSCTTGGSGKQEQEQIPQRKPDQLQTGRQAQYEQQLAKPIPKAPKPIFGYRFQLRGDFDGDGNQEVLTERFISGITHQETNKYYENLPDYNALVEITGNKQPVSLMTCDNSRIDTLHIAATRQLLGLYYVKNEGDLNGDGGDEVSYVINYADWSSVNTWHIATYRNNKWSELYSFGIWEWQLPDMPGSVNQYGMFGLEESSVIPPSDSLNQVLEMERKAFPGLVKKLRNNKIRVIYRNEEAQEDTMVVNLRHLKVGR